MMKTLTCAAVLTAHPRTSSVSVNAIDARLTYGEGKTLTLVYQLKGDMARLRVPFSQSSQRTDGLWQHTCFEAFIRTNASPDYYEFNFSPSGEWAAYSFRGYRDAGPIDDVGLSPEIVVRREARKIELDAVVHLDRLPALRRGSLLRLGLSAVIESSDGALSYWALKHPADKPDFHHPDSFALELALPERSA